MESVSGLRNRKKADGLLESLSERLEDGVTSEPLTQAVTLNCGHSYNESTVVSLRKQDPSKQLCPECRTPIQSFQPSYALRNLAESIALLPPSSDPAESPPPQEKERSEPYSEEAQAHFQRGKALYDQGLQEESVAAVLRALELNPNFEKALDFLDFITDPKRNLKPSAISSPPPSKPIVEPVNPYKIAYEAITSNNKELFLSVANVIEDWNKELPSGDNLVHCAAMSFNLFFLNFIIKKASRECLSAACNKYNNRGFLPIHCAAEAGSFICLNTLLQVAPYSANATTKEFETPIFVAVVNNKSACIDPLCAAGANLSIRGKGGVTPLMKAIECHYPSCIRELLRMSTEISKDTLHLVMELQLTRLFKTLLDRGIDVNLMGITGEEGFCPLHVAVRLGWLDGVKILMQSAGIKLNAECLWGKTALDYAIEGNQYDIGEYLIEKGAISKHNYSFLWFRIWNARSFISRWIWGSNSMYEISLPPLKMTKSHGAKMELFVKTIDGKMHTILVSPSDKIREICQLIGHLPNEHEKIYFGGKNLDLNQTFANYNIQECATIHFIGQLRGD